jgi:hypothetical protein
VKGKRQETNCFLEKTTFIIVFTQFSVRRSISACLYRTTFSPAEYLASEAMLFYS